MCISRNIHIILNKHIFLPGTCAAAKVTAKASTNTALKILIAAAGSQTVPRVIANPFG